MSKKTLGILALLGATLFWGPGPVITKLGLQQIPPYSFAFLRFIIAALLIAPFFFWQGHHRTVSKIDLPKFIMIGLFGSGLNVIFFMTGLTMTTATTSSAIFATVPLVNALAAFFLLKESPSVIRILGVIVGLIGSFIVALGPSFLGSGIGISGNILGNLFIVLAVFSWVIYIIVSKELLEKYSPLTLTLISFGIGALCLLPLSYYELVHQPGWYLNLNSLSTFLIPYSAIFISVVPFMLYQWGMKQTSAFEAGLVTYLNPVLAVMIAIPLLGETPTPIFIVGTALILSGVFLASAYELVISRYRSK